MSDWIRDTVKVASGRGLSVLAEEIGDARPVRRLDPTGPAPSALDAAGSAGAAGVRGTLLGIAADVVRNKIVSEGIETAGKVTKVAAGIDQAAKVTSALRKVAARANAALALNDAAEAGLRIAGDLTVSAMESGVLAAERQMFPETRPENRLVSAEEKIAELESAMERLKEATNAGIPPEKKGGSCPRNGDTCSDGSRCGGRSAWSRGPTRGYD